MNHEKILQNEEREELIQFFRKKELTEKMEAIVNSTRFRERCKEAMDDIRNFVEVSVENERLKKSLDNLLTMEKFEKTIILEFEKKVIEEAEELFGIKDIYMTIRDEITEEMAIRVIKDINEELKKKIFRMKILLEIE